MFGRRNNSTDTAAASTASTASTSSTEQSQSELDDAAQAARKGRATPTRKEAEAARKARLAPPRSRKELAAKQRADRVDSRRKMQEAMATGDDRYLPARDRGPAKRFTRDYVDSRWTIGELMLPIFVVVFVSTLVSPTVAIWSLYAWVAIIIAMIVDAIRLARGAKAGVAAKFGADETKGIAFYAVMRGWQMRRLRLPKVQVKRGGEPV